MTSFFKKPIGIFRKIWFWFLLLITINQLAILASYYVLIAYPTASSLTTVFMGLADVIHRGQSQNSKEGFGVIQDRWVSGNHIMVIEGPPKNLGPKPSNPGFWVIEAKLREDWGDRVEFGFSSKPERMLWLYFPKEDRPFSIGMPFNVRLKTQIAMVFSICLIFILTIVAAWLVSVRLGRPLKELADMASKMGRGEAVDPSGRFDFAPPEVNSLSTALHKMQDEIHQMQLERERFLEGIAHDLRTPLSRMRVAVEFPEISNSSLANGLSEDIDEMRIILDQFLELSRLDAEKSELFMEGDISSFISEIVGRYQRASAPVSMLLEKDCFIRFRPIAFTRLFYNLIDNSLRHGVGSVLIKTSIIDRKVCISVSNIAAEFSELPVLIKALKWVGGEHQSGLGTAIIRRLADVHAATIKMESVNSSDFSISIEFDLIHLAA